MRCPDRGSVGSSRKFKFGATPGTPKPVAIHLAAAARGQALAAEQLIEDQRIRRHRWFHTSSGITAKLSSPRPISMSPDAVVRSVAALALRDVDDAS
jgi:hypothetical protein